ncbi:hypothetical protein CH63R_13341 [Colletotrichum higginsianum IMI 349063]|uniref:Uncharacterized protein n=2 Tax=Colletotrichum higginsianum TaxID=80884 RepID=A0A1B7XWU7_COLHI|nr:hypothetical protein CH63R_13341 [Colletotrichum higginsianum IMI 349063]OBR04214.1 hypothetical protein CH63R_13341 [Colletotrichum higginsianum IMI 349063]TIC90218.1 hypothetical protein CH35J_012187 [Colletotrichum higginsianum]
MVSSASCFALLGLGASAVNAIPKANYLIPHPPETFTLTTCGSQCARTVTVTETFTETAPYFYTCGPPSSPATTSTVDSLTLSATILLPPLSTARSITNSTTRVTPSSSTRSPSGTGIIPTLTSFTKTSTPTPGFTVSSQLPSAVSPSSSAWGVNSTSSRISSRSDGYATGTGSPGTSVSSGRAVPSSSLWSNSTEPITRTVTRTVRKSSSGSSTKARVTIPTIPIISIPPPPVTSTGSEPATSPGLSYSLTTYTTVRVINTTVSSQLPGLSTLSRSASRTTLRTTVVVTITNTIPLGTGTANSSTSSGTGVSSRFPALSSSSSIRLSNSLSYGTTTTKATSSTVSSKVPCSTSTKTAPKLSTSSNTPGTTVSSALASLVTPTGTAKTRTIPGAYDSSLYSSSSSSSAGTTVESAKPSLVTGTTSGIPGAYESELLTLTPGTTVSDVLPTLITPTLSLPTLSPGYGEYPPVSEEPTSTGSPGTTVASALPSLVTPTTLETRTSDAYVSPSVYTSYNYGQTL